jgi:hypothetical protein
MLSRVDLCILLVGNPAYIFFLWSLPVCMQFYGPYIFELSTSCLQSVVVSFCSYIFSSESIQVCNFRDPAFFNSVYILSPRLGVAQSVQCTDWTTGIWSPAGVKDFSSSLCAQTGSGAYPAPLSVGTGELFPVSTVRPGRDADHSPLSICIVLHSYWNPGVNKCTWLTRSCSYLSGFMWRKEIVPGFSNHILKFWVSAQRTVMYEWTHPHFFNYKIINIIFTITPIISRVTLRMREL